MSAYADAMTELGKVHFPYVFSQIFADTCTIVSVAPTSDGAGGYTQGTPTNSYTNIPVEYKPAGGAKYDTNGKLISIKAYTVTIPTHYDNAGTPTRINIDPTIHRIVTNTRGNELAKTFRIMSVGDEIGIEFVLTCEKEN